MLLVCIHFTNQVGIVKKILAYLFMLCGIIAMYFEGIMPDTVIIPLRLLGFVSMPFFAQALVDGFFLTRNTYKYFFRVAFTTYLAQAMALLSFLLFDSPQPRRFNIGFTWLITFVLLFGLELLVSLPRDRIASLNLLSPNQTTNSTRFDVVMDSGAANHLPKGMKVPSWPRSTLHGLAILLFATCMILITFLPLTMSLMSIMTVLIFYFLHRWKIDSRVFVVTIFYSAFAACYTYLYFRMTGIISWEGISLLGFLLCLLIPEKKRKKPAMFYRSLYLVYPVCIFLCAFAASLF